MKVVTEILKIMQAICFKKFGQRQKVSNRDIFQHNKDNLNNACNKCGSRHEKGLGKKKQMGFCGETGEMETDFIIACGSSLGRGFTSRRIYSNNRP